MEEKNNMGNAKNRFWGRQWEKHQITIRYYRRLKLRMEKKGLPYEGPRWKEIMED